MCLVVTETAVRASVLAARDLTRVSKPSLSAKTLSIVTLALSVTELSLMSRTGLVGVAMLGLDGCVTAGASPRSFTEARVRRLVDVLRQLLLGSILVLLEIDGVGHVDALSVDTGRRALGKRVLLVRNVALGHRDSFDERTVLTIVSIVTEAHTGLAHTTAVTVLGTKTLRAVLTTPSFVTLTTSAVLVSVGENSKLLAERSSGLLGLHSGENTLSVVVTVVLTRGLFTERTTPPVAAFAGSVVTDTTEVTVIHTSLFATSFSSPRGEACAGVVVLDITETVLGGSTVERTAAGVTRLATPVGFALAALETTLALLLAFVTHAGAELLLATNTAPALLALALGEAGGVVLGADSVTATVEVAVIGTAVVAVVSTVTLAETSLGVADTVRGTVVGTVCLGAVDVEVLLLTGTGTGLGVALSLAGTVVGTHLLHAVHSGETLGAHTLHRVLEGLALSVGVVTLLGAALHILTVETLEVAVAHTALIMTVSVAVAVEGASSHLASLTEIARVTFALGSLSSIDTLSVVHAVVRAHLLRAVIALPALTAVALALETVSVSGTAIEAGPLVTFGRRISAGRRRITATGRDIALVFTLVLPGSITVFLKGDGIIFTSNHALLQQYSVEVLEFFDFHGVQITSVKATS